MSLYTCVGCTDPIRPDKARIKCSICTPAYDLCANCFVINQFTPPSSTSNHPSSSSSQQITHVATHPTQIFKTSGTTIPVVPPPFPPRPVPLIPQINNASVAQIEIPTANWGALWDIVKPKAGKKREEVKKSEEFFNGMRDKDANDFEPVMTTGSGLRPMLPPRLGTGFGEGSTMPREWSAFFGGKDDQEQMEIFGLLMAEIFRVLDVERTGYLSPEIWSAYLDMQGVPMMENVWQKTLYAGGGIQNQEIADLELGIFYKTNEIQHILSVRNRPSLTPNTEEAPSLGPKSPSLAGDRIRKSISLGANMPLLTQKGFTDINALSLLEKPDEGWLRLVGVVSNYGVWKGLGDLPRGCLPEKGRGKVKRKSWLEMSLEVEKGEKQILEELEREVAREKTLNSEVEVEEFKEEKEGESEEKGEVLDGKQVKTEEQKNGRAEEETKRVNGK